MGRSRIDTSNRLDPEQIAELTALHSRVNGEGTLPAFGEPNQETWILRDTDDGKIVGFIHFEHLVEIRAITTDPGYEHKKMALTIAHEAMETVLRRFQHTHYYITIPADHEHVRRFYEREGGGERVDMRTVRFRKEL